MSDLASKWLVLETEARASSALALSAVSSGVRVEAGEIEVAADVQGRRYLLLPLLPGEAVIEDREGQAVHFYRLRLGGVDMAALVCLEPRLHDIFYRLCAEALEGIDESASPARYAGTMLSKWKELLAPSKDTHLGDGPLVGLIAELLCLGELSARGHSSPIDAWTGPLKARHDFECGAVALEVKGSLLREGRKVTINGVDQLDRAPADRLLLAFHRFERCLPEQGLTLNAVLDELLESGLAASDLYKKIAAEGDPSSDLNHYAARPFRWLERSLYDTAGEAFPSITRQSFAGGVLPPGTSNLSYAIDLTNAPPVPLTEEQAEAAWADLAGVRHV